MLAIYYLINMPSVTITSATLVIQGQPNLDEFMLRGDFDSNGRTDILWRHEVSGQNVVWSMDGAVRQSGTFTTPSTLPT